MQNHAASGRNLKNGQDQKFSSAYGFGFAFGQAPALPFSCSAPIVGASVPLRFSPASSSFRYAVYSMRHLVTLAAHSINPFTHAPTLFPHCTATLTPSQEQRADHIWLLIAGEHPQSARRGVRSRARSRIRAERTTQILRRQRKQMRRLLKERACPHGSDPACFFRCYRSKKSAGKARALQVVTQGDRKQA